MRKITILLLTVLACATALAGDKNTTILVRPISEAQRNEIPDKTIQNKWQLYALTDEPLAKAIGELVADVRNEDSWHNVYVLKFHTTDEGLLEVGVIGLNELKGPVMTKDSWGVILHDSACFILLDEKPEGVFNKAKGKHSIIQEFEILDAYFQESHTVVYANWKEGKLRAKVYVINDHDNLPERQRKENGNIMVDHFE